MLHHKDYEGSEPENTHSAAKQDVNSNIFIKSCQNSIRPYSSSPCLLPEIEDDEDVLNL